MPVQRSYQPSDIEKRLKLLTQQLYGKQKEVASSPLREASKLPASPKFQRGEPTTDVAFLKKDLTKIAILASLAIGAQLILYFSQLPSKINLF